MSRDRRRQHVVAGELNLTAMIDVAFQLLAFFIITVHPMDVVTNVNVFRPSGDVVDGDVPPRAIRVAIYKDAFTINENPIEFKGLDKVMSKLAVHDKTQTILIMCRKESKHSQLVDVLNLCAKLKLTNLSVISSN